MIRPDTSAQVIIMADLVMTTPLTSVMYASPPQIAAGWTASTYAMVMKVVSPAMISVFLSVPRRLSWKNLSIRYSLFFFCLWLIYASASANTGTNV